MIFSNTYIQQQQELKHWTQQNKEQRSAVTLIFGLHIFRKHKFNLVQ